MTVACDIGGVVRDLATGAAVDGALEGLAQLASSHRLVFISKCGPGYKELILSWLAARDLSVIPIFFCEEDEQKVNIAREQGVAVMVDDRIQVLRTFPQSVTKIWLCSDEKKIAGTIKHQRELFDTFQHARTWPEVMDFVQAREEVVL
jgi:hypothetical protein